MSLKFGHTRSTFGFHGLYKIRGLIFFSFFKRYLLSLRGIYIYYLLTSSTTLSILYSSVMRLAVVDDCQLPGIQITMKKAFSRCLRGYFISVTCGRKSNHKCGASLFHGLGTRTE